MKLGTLKDKTWDGTLVVVSKDNSKFVRVPDIAANFRSAIETWANCKDRLSKVYDDLNSGEIEGEGMDEALFHSPLPRTFQWADGSAFSTMLSWFEWLATLKCLTASLKFL